MDNMVDSEPSRAWPDGNTSLLRLLVSKLIPAAFPDVDGGRPNQENIVKAACDYTQLDRPGNTVRIRLNCLVTNVKPAGRGDRYAEVVYTPVGGSGKPVGFRVRGSHVVMACWNRVTAHLVDGLPRRQVDDLCYARKVPLIYGRGVLNNWQAWADAKISSVSPRGKSLFWDSTLDQRRRAASAAPTGRRRTSRRRRRRRSRSPWSRTTRGGCRRSRPTSRAASSCSR